MVAGVSSACLYPMHTEDSLRILGELGVKNVEVFFSDNSEASGSIFAEITDIVKSYEMNVISVHPYSSPMETMFLFSEYDRREQTLLDIYKGIFDSMTVLDAKLFVLHGAILSAKCNDERYIDRFMRLTDIAKDFGITIVQENISYCKSSDIDFLKMLKNECDAKFVLDIKQAVRSGISPIKIIEALGDSILHIHASDNGENGDCLPIGKGSFDFPSLISALNGIDYNGALLVELYRNNFGEPAELFDSMKKLEALL